MKELTPMELEEMRFERQMQILDKLNALCDALKETREYVNETREYVKETKEAATRQ